VRLALAVVASAVVASAVLAGAAPASGQTITTIAGTGQHARSPDGATAAASPIALALDSTANVVFDAHGNLCFSESDAARVRRINRKTGRLETIAGTGVAGFSGDGGPATAARLAAPAEIAFDRDGNLFLADAANQVIRRVDARTGIITTVAGVPGRMLGEPEGPIALNRPGGITFDGNGRLVIADTLAAKLRRLDPKTGALETLAGTGDLMFLGTGPARTRGFSWPLSPRFDRSGALYFCSAGANQVLRIDPATDVLAPAAGDGGVGDEGDGGRAVRARFNQPAALAIDAAGNVFIADTQNNAIRRLDAKTGILTHVAGNGRGEFGGDGGPASAAALWNPNGLGLDGKGNLYVIDATNGRIRKIEGVAAR
jgi:sugar lactone lactonase YvrE